jgi:diguanylate cyclase (GGDEF)-like protein
MLPPTAALSTQLLAEFLAVLSAAPDGGSATQVAVERAARALEAEAAVVLGRDGTVSSIGFAFGHVPIAEISEVIAGRRRRLDVPGAVGCHTSVAPLGGSQPGHLLVARSGDDGFSVDEVSLVRGIARALELTLGAMQTFEAERRRAAENAGLVTTLQERQRLLEQLSRIQRGITRRAPLQTILDAITNGAQELLGDDVAGLRMIDPADPQTFLLVSATGLTDELTARTWRTPTETGATGLASMRNEVIVIDDYHADPHRIPEYADLGIRRVMAAPVHQEGRVVGSLAVGSYRPDRIYTRAEQEVLEVFAEHVSLALTDAKMHEAMYEAYHDSLTGLASRTLFMDQLAHALAIAGHERRRIAALFVDLDRFKIVNDSLGHAAGDALLVEVAARLRSCLSPSDSAARLGGDEFALLLPDVDIAQAEAVATEILNVLNAPFILSGHEVFVTASIGIALNTDFAALADTLIRDADLAMYQAKKSGTGGYATYQPAMQALFLRSLDLEAELRRALDQGELVVHYQPIVRLDDQRIMGLEALVRWPHPGRGLLLPGEFVPHAEESGLIIGVDRFVLRQACLQVSQWNAQRSDQAPLAVGVNLAASQLQQADLPSVVESILADTGLQPDCLTLEITESLLLADNPATVDRLQRLKALPLRLAIDDFGTGYSSLAYLRRFPVDGIKIDKSFIDDIATDRGSAAVVRAIVQIGLTLGLTVVSEGVEFPEQVAALRRAGCRYGQGYYFAAPMDAHSLERHLGIGEREYQY